MDGSKCWSCDDGPESIPDCDRCHRNDYTGQLECVECAHPLLPTHDGSTCWLKDCHKSEEANRFRCAQCGRGFRMTWDEKTCVGECDEHYVQYDNPMLCGERCKDHQFVDHDTKACHSCESAIPGCHTCHTSDGSSRAVVCDECKNNPEDITPLVPT